MIFVVKSLILLQSCAFMLSRVLSSDNFLDPLNQKVCQIGIGKHYSSDQWPHWSVSLESALDHTMNILLILDSENLEWQSKQRCIVQAICLVQEFNRSTGA